MTDNEKLEIYIHQMLRQHAISGECVDELILLVSEISQHCPQSFVDYASKELLRIYDKYTDVVGEYIH